MALVFFLLVLLSLGITIPYVIVSIIILGFLQGERQEMFAEYIFLVWFMVAIFSSSICVIFDSIDPLLVITFNGFGFLGS